MKCIQQKFFLFSRKRQAKDQWLFSLRAFQTFPPFGMIRKLIYPMIAKKTPPYVYYVSYLLERITISATQPDSDVSIEGKA